jgi:hypothetical protein
MTVTALCDGIRRPLELAYHPHYLGPRISFIEVQEPSDHIVIAETSGNDEFGRLPVRSGQTFALPASVPFLIRAGTAPVRVVRCMGPLS